MAAITTDAELDRQVEQAKIPQAWYQAPEGWMQKPDFKRKEQIPGSTGKSGGLASMFKSKK